LSAHDLGHAACLAVVDGTDLTEECGSALFKAALAAIGNAERRFAQEAGERERERGTEKRNEGAMPHARPARQG
jgi:hypothetical protein